MRPVPKGCKNCDFTGYKGRVGIYEMLELTSDIRSAIRNGCKNDEIRMLARQNGMRLMQESALEQVHEGLTSLEEVQRVVPFDAIRGAECPKCGRELSERFLFCPQCGERRDGRGAMQEREPLAAQGAVH